MWTSSEPWLALAVARAEARVSRTSVGSASSASGASPSSASAMAPSAARFYRFGQLGHMQADGPQKPSEEQGKCSCAREAT